jgi:hypothetical protein
VREVRVDRGAENFDTELLEFFNAVAGERKKERKKERRKKDGRKERDQATKHKATRGETNLKATISVGQTKVKSRG